MARGAGAVGCAHCTLIGADRACQVCTRIVCGRCGSDWTTCPEPSGRVVRLGVTARLRDVDPTGRYGLVSHWRRPLRVFDLRRLRWIHDVHVDRRAYLWNRGYPVRLTGDGRAIYAEWTGFKDSESNMFAGMRAISLHGGRETTMSSAEAPARATAVTATRDIFYYVTRSERVGVIHGDAWAVVDPMPRKVIHAVHLDGERDLLAAGSWSEVVLFGLVDGQLAPLSRGKTATHGDVCWIAVAGPWLLAAVKLFGGPTTIEAYRLGRDLTIGELERRYPVRGLRAASVSRDGRYLALATGHELHVHDLDREAEAVFTEHTDVINFVRFAGDDHTLISADTDNRVLLRPRTPAGYARPLIPIDVPVEAVPLTA